MAYFLLKTEPSTYSYDDLVREKRAVWSGVSNAAALIHLRSVRTGDRLFIYHTGDERAIVGLSEAVSLAYQDPAQPGLNARGEPAHAVFDVAPIAKAKQPVLLSALKADKRFQDFTLLTHARLSVMPVPAPIARALCLLAGLPE